MEGIDGELHPAVDGQRLGEVKLTSTVCAKVCYCPLPDVHEMFDVDTR